MKLILEGQPPTNNQLLRTHWAARKRRKTAWAWELKVQIPPEYPIGKEVRKSVRITVFLKTRRYDVTNLYGGLKDIEDCLVDLGLIKDDSPAWIDLDVSQHLDPARPRVEIEILEAK